MDLAGVHLQINAFKDLMMIDADVEISNFK